jgi:hypothetical protein
MSPLIEPFRLSTALRAPASEHGADWVHDDPEPVGEAYKVVCTDACAMEGIAAVSAVYVAAEINPSAESQRAPLDQKPRAFMIATRYQYETSCRDLSCCSQAADAPCGR